MICSVAPASRAEIIIAPIPRLTPSSSPTMTQVQASVNDRRRPVTISGSALGR